MTNKKTLTKLMSLLLSLILALSLGGTAFAAEVQPLASSADTTGSITLTNAVANEEYMVYQIFELTYSDDVNGAPTSESSYSYKVAPGWAEFIAGYTYEGEYLFIMNIDGYLSTASPIFSLSDDSDVIAQFAKDALAYAQSAGISGTRIGFSYDPETGTATPYDGCVIGAEGATEADGIVTAQVHIDGLSLGYYLVGTSLGALCILSSASPSAAISDKNPVPVLEKYVRDITPKDYEGEETTADNADVIDTLEYEIILRDVSNVHNLCLHDVIDDDMCLVGGSVKVYLNGNAETGEPVDEGSYTLRTEPEDGCCFEILFEDDYLETLDSDDVFYVIYEVTLEEEEDWEGDLHDFRNVAHLSYGYATVSPDAATDTWSYGFEIHKYTQRGADVLDLAGAKFVVWYLEDNTEHYAQFESAGDGRYILSGWTTTQAEATVLTTPEGGMLYLEGFDPDTVYYLEETEAPDGYNKLNGIIIVRFVVDEGDASVFTVTYTYENKTTEAEDLVVQVLNNTGVVLPSTGGSGTGLFYLIGIAAVTAAAALVVRRRRNPAA